MVPTGFTLEERARLTDDEAVRRRFDQKNLTVLRWARWPLVAVALGLLFAGLDGEAPAIRGGVAALHLAASIAAAIAIGRAARPAPLPPGRGSAAAAWIRSRPRSFTIATILVYFVFAWVAAFGRSPGSLLVAVLFGAFVLTIRLAVAETILVYAFFAGMTVLEGFLTRGDDGELVAALVNLGFALGINLMITRRQRVGFLADWHAMRPVAIEQIRLREELDFAREVQLSMLPRGAPPIPWLEVASLSLPATEVGGDYYDYFPLPDGRFAAVIGDVAGHGLASGMVLSGIRSCLTLLIDELDAPADVMARLDLMLRKTTAHRMFVTLSILLIDPLRRSVLITSAGHPPTFVYRANGGEVERIETASLPLGTRLPSRFDQRRIELRTRDVLLIQTDGLYETTDAAGEPYGFDRLAAAFGAASADAPLTERRDAILRDLASFRGVVPQQDDVTIVLFRFRESAVPAELAAEEMLALS